MYARAREHRADWWAEELIEIADNPVKAEKVTIKPDGTRERVIGDAVDRARLRHDARKWLMAKANPRLYGERTTIAGDPDAPLVVEDGRKPIAELIAAAKPKSE